ncbi:MAG: response regulator transcription factor [Chloroflexi bacterium]|nr:response regulator transcription factor [Chloroflexota bacterium]
MEQIRVLLVDDHSILREGLRSLLSTNGSIRVVGEARDGKEAVDRAHELQPDVVLMDIAMPRMDGLEATRLIKKADPSIKVLVLTQHENRPYVFRILKAGASGYVLKKAASTDLIAAIHQVHHGKSFLDPSVTEMVIERCLENLPEDSAEADYEGLSDREREVLKLVGEGHTNQEIADVLCISINTVLTHRSSLMKKLGAHNRAELIKYAIRVGLVEIDGAAANLPTHR